MKAIQYWERLKKINVLIKAKRTGTPKELANSLGISESHLFRTIDELCDMGVDICYSRADKTYYYNNGIEISLSYSLKLISENDEKEIYGGCNISVPLLLFESGKPLLYCL